MISGSIKTSGNWRALKGVSSALLGRQQMRDLGDFTIKVVKARVARGIGSDDSPMPPLKTVGVGRKGRPRQYKYPIQKGSTVRNLRSPGKGPHMLDQMVPVELTGNSVVIGFSSQDAYKKAGVNEARAPWIGFSPSDVRAIVEHAQDLLDAQVAGIISDLKRGKL